LTEPNKQLENVGEETMQYAIDLCHYFIRNIPLPQKTELVKMETKTFKVLEMLKKGMKQVDIAAELHVSPQYVSTIKKKYKITI
jgi:DNA-binding NarL/FixJ family response regulator